MEFIRLNASLLIAGGVVFHLAVLAACVMFAASSIIRNSRKYEEGDKRRFHRKEWRHWRKWVKLMAIPGVQQVTLVCYLVLGIAMTISFTFALVFKIIPGAITLAWRTVFNTEDYIQ